MFYEICYTILKVAILLFICGSEALKALIKTHSEHFKIKLLLYCNWVPTCNKNKIKHENEMKFKIKLTSSNIYYGQISFKPN